MIVLVVVLFALLVFFITVAIFGEIGKINDSKERRLDFVGVKSKKELYEEFEQSFFQRFILPWLKSLRKYVPKLGTKKTDYNAILAQKLRLAGIKMSPEEFSGVKLIVTICIFVVGIIVILTMTTDLTVRFLGILCVAILIVLTPRYYLTSRITMRRTKIENQLPEVVDVLCVSLEAGLGFDAALLKIAERMKGPLIEEFMVLYKEIQMGRPRSQALKNLGDCSDIGELKTFASAVAQGEQLGIPIKNILKVQSSKLRLERRQRAQEKGMKAPIKMMLPMVAFVFPVIFIILLGPTIIKLINQFG